MEVDRRGFMKGMFATVLGCVPGVKLLSEYLEERRIRRIISTPEGRRRLAASMIEPLRRRRDYMRLSRKCLMVEAIV